MQTKAAVSLTTGLEDAERVTIAMLVAVAAGGQLLICPICFNARYVGEVDLESNAKLGGTVQMWDWIGDDPVTTFSY